MPNLSVVIIASTNLNLLLILSLLKFALNFSDKTINWGLTLAKIEI